MNSSSRKLVLFPASAFSRVSSSSFCGLNSPCRRPPLANKSNCIKQEIKISREKCQRGSRLNEPLVISANSEEIGLASCRTVVNHGANGLLIGSARGTKESSFKILCEHIVEEPVSYRLMKVAEQRLSPQSLCLNL